MNLGSFSINLAVKDIEASREADENATGPVSFVVIDPDDNPILIDQHV